MILSLREVNSYLAVICVLHDEAYSRRSQLDYNIDRFRDSLKKVIDEANEIRPSFSKSVQ